MVGCRVSKCFPSGTFEGRVAKIDIEEGTGTKLFVVLYNDGDTEDLYLGQLQDILAPEAATGAVPAAPTSPAAAAPQARQQKRQCSRSARGPGAPKKRKAKAMMS